SWLMSSASAATSGEDEIRIGLIGAGSQGRILINAANNIPNVRFVAVADVWEYSRTYASGILRAFDQPSTVYEDYREMIDKEDLDAVLIATPDWNHAPQTVDCLEAGLHVYCEKEMSNTLEGAQKMVRAARKTGKLLQIGHQRRSNPRYRHAERMIKYEKILGRVVAVNGQWNRPVQEPLGWPQRFTISEDELSRWGYDSMDQFVNWRWYKKYSGGPIVDLGSHQLEVYNWFLGATPKAVLASGGIDYYDDGREWYDNVMVIYEYLTEQGPARAFYQVLNTSSHGGFSETFMGDEGTMVISEDASVGHILREVRAPRREWEDLSDTVETMGREAIALKIGETRGANPEREQEVLQAEEDLNKPEHQPHLENFFAAIRGKAKLNCDADLAYETAVTTLSVNKAIAAGGRLDFKPGEFKVS
ncbi:MAG: Gfo/Idh/MocA family oxidoreductase, partial [Candidatus Sumerlaeia bacterium]|nr:Gfo/Idh/MocA family oxidoreductase [Candidatus Sumerlaeia bacterium]